MTKQVDAMPEVPVLELPVIDFSKFLNGPDTEEAKLECQKVASTLKEYGVLIVRDPRVSFEHNSEFIDMMEQYFEQDYDLKLKDARPEFHYQVGVTPGGQEDPKCKSDLHCQKLIETLPESSKPLKADGPDPKWRFFWSMGKKPAETKFQALNAPQVLPKAFEEQWPIVMNKWGGLMIQAVTQLTEMLAVGLDLPRDTFKKMCEYGPHLLAPTGSDLNEFNKLDTVLAGFHYDLNFLTIHGKSRFPGLNVWARNSALKIGVKVPDGCLLVQAGKQLEYLTGGAILAGYHEVVINEKTIEAIESAKKQGKSLWRVSSTSFLHIGSDQLLEPLLPTQNQAQYPPILCGDFVQEELSFINLKK